MATAKKQFKGVKTREPHIVLFGTYVHGMLEKWKGFYNYPITDADKITDDDAKFITELRLYSGKKKERIFKAKFVGIKTRDELVAEYGYKASGKGHGDRYLLFKRLSETKGKTVADKMIVRTRDFAKRTPEVARQLKTFLDSPDRKNPLLAKYLPEIIVNASRNALSVHVDGIQLDFLPTLMSRQHIVPKNGISVTSFFCGCGGLDLGFRGDFTYKGQNCPRTAFEILHAYDNNHKHIITYQNNVGSDASVLDLSDFDVRQTPRARVLIGGFPCQDFATCGPRRGLNSTRGRLYQAMIKYANAYNPEIIVGENVPGLENIENGAILERIKTDVQNAGDWGYHVQVWKMYAPDYGIPQSRTRLIIVAVRNDIDGFPKEPEKAFTPANYRTTRWAIEDLEDVVDEAVPNQSQYFRAAPAHNGNGQGDEISPADAPSYTIRANAKSRVQFHYRLDRRLTVRECARIQTFPDTFVFPHAATTNIMEIGNAVPPMLGYLIASSIQNFLKEKHNEHPND